MHIHSSQFVVLLMLVRHFSSATHKVKKFKFKIFGAITFRAVCAHNKLSFAEKEFNKFLLSLFNFLLLVILDDDVDEQ